MTLAPPAPPATVPPLATESPLATEPPFATAPRLATAAFPSAANVIMVFWLLAQPKHHDHHRLRLSGYGAAGQESLLGSVGLLGLGPGR
jgi:hypothetical protein